jgi:COMPASS component SWD2
MKVIDAFDGNTLAMLGGHKNTRKLPLKGLFTPDGQMVLCGSEDGYVHVWNAKVKHKTTVLFD